MAGPWEKYQAAPEAADSAPWAKYAGAQDAMRAEYDPTKDMGVGERLLASTGRGMYNAYQGLAGLFGKGETAEERASREATDAPLLNTTSGKVGNALGTAAMAAPALLVPGANTLAGATMIGGATGAAMTPGNASERGQAAIEGALGGALGQSAGQFIGAGVNALRNSSAIKAATKAATNAGKDAAVAKAQGAGYVVTPAMTSQPGFIGSASEALGGKIKTQQLASVRNQQTTNGLVRNALGMEPDAQITPAALKQIRSDAGQAYEVIRSTGTVQADQQFAKELSDIGKQYQGAAASFPGLTKGNPVQDIVDSLNQPQFAASDAVDAIRVLREAADKAYRAGDTGLGKASKSAASALEDMLDRHAQSSGLSSDALDAYRTARKTIAKTYSVQGALNEGTGDVAAAKLGNQLRKGKPLSGELKDVAEFANAFPKAVQSDVTVPRFSVLDMAMGGAGLGAGNVPAMAVPLLRPGARALALSGPVQRSIGTANYAPNQLLIGADNAFANPALQRALIAGSIAAPTYQK